MKLEELANKLNNGNAEPELLRDLANLLTRKGNIESANYVLSFLCKTEPSIENIILYSESLIQSVERDLIVKGIGLLNEILNYINLAPEYSFEVRKLLGNAYTKLGDRRTAKVFYENCLKIDSNSDIVCSNLGIMFYQQQDYQNAKMFFDQALDINSQNTSALTGIALILFENNLFEQALDMLEQALNIEPANLVALNTMVNISLKNGRLLQVLPRIEQYLQTDPFNSDILYTYAVILYQLGRSMHAAFELDKILISDPDYSYAGELKQIINSQSLQKVNMEVINNG